VESDSLDQSFPKIEKLKSKKIIDALFQEGHSKVFFPLRIVWLETQLPESVPVQCGVSVSKKNFPNATDRNRIKRQLRETYRLNKTQLSQKAEQNNQQLGIMLLFIDKKFCDFSEIHRQTQRALRFVSQKITADYAQSID